MWNVPVRFLVMWSPIVAVSIGGGIYIYECTQTLLSPGTGFTIDYPAKNDTLKITCKTYNIDLVEHTVIIDQLVVRRKNGELLARIPHFVATGISAFGGMTPKIQLKDAELWATRDEKGELDVLNLFESKPATATEQPWQVSVRDSVVHLHDLSVPGGVRNDVKVETGNFVGRGENIEGGTKVDIPELAKGQVGFKKDAESTIIYGKEVSGKLAPILARLRAGHEKPLIATISPLKIGSGDATGDFTITISKNPIKLVSNFTASVENAQWDLYHADQVAFVGSISESGLTGKAKFSEKQMKGVAEGTLHYGKETAFGANINVSGVTPALLDSLKLKLPKDVAFANAYAKGYLSYNKEKFGWKGKSSFVNASVYGLKLPHLDGDVTLQGDQFLASIKPTPIGGTFVDGNVSINLKTQAILGAFSTPQLSAKDFSKWLPSNVLESKARLVGLIDGTIAHPNVLVKGSIDPRVKLADRTLSYNPAEVVLRYDGNTFQLDRLSLTDDTGSLYASGSIDLKKGINVRVVGNNVDLAKVAANTSGKLDVQGVISGKLDALKYGGKLQGYQIAYDGVAGKVVAIATNFNGDMKGIQFSELDAMKGASQITGSLGIGFADQKLAGAFAVEGVEISDLYEGAVGGIDLRDIKVSGTLTNPMVTGEFDAKKILAGDFSIDTAEGKISYDGSRFRVFDTTASFANGRITSVTGDLDPKTKSGTVNGKFHRIDLADIQQTMRQKAKTSKDESLYQLLTNLSARGSSSGTLELGIKGGTFANFAGNGRVDDVFLNKAKVGSGDWDVVYDGKTWTGNALIGSLEEYFKMEAMSFTPQTEALGGEFLSYQFPVQELIVAAQPSLNWSDDMIKRLELVTGKLTSIAKFSGTASNPTIDIPDFEISSIKLGKEGEGKVEDIGTFSMKATLNNEAFTITDGLLVGPKVSKITLPFSGTFTLPANVNIPDGTARLAGTVKDRNALNYDLSGSIFGFPVSKFAPLAPALSDLDVFVSQANFKLSGNIQAPTLASHVKMSAGLSAQGKKAHSGLLASRLNIDADVSAKPSSSQTEGASLIDANGTFKFDSIEGTIAGHALASSTGIDEKAPFSLLLKLNGDRDVTDFLKQAGGMQLGEKGAQLSGSLEVGNTWENPTFIGGFNLRADSVKSVSVQPMIGKPLDTTLKDVLMSASFENDPKLGNLLRTQLSTATNYSKVDPKVPNLGYVKFDAKVPINQLLSLKGNTGGWKNTDIYDGTLSFSDLALYQSFAQGTYAQGSISTEAGKPILVAGSLSTPKISGSIFFDDVKTIIPTLLPTPGSSVAPAIEPEFDLKFFANTPMTIKSSLTTVNAKGAGSIKGSLSELKADGVLTVEKGDMLLPGGKVKLLPEGTITLKYDAAKFRNQAQLIADLRGEAFSTSLRNGTPERYEIALVIKGDMLASDANKLDNPEDQTQGLTITGTSQFGALTAQEISALLGRTDILQSILQTGVNSNIRDELEKTLTGLFLPSALGGITNELAKSFNLDYVGVDYNAFEQASISAVKNLGNGFFLQGRQQLMQPLPGKPAAYDFRLVYRPRRGPSSIRALSFSLGTDQLRPYKFSIDYSTQIRTRKAPYQIIKLDVPNK